MAKVDSAEEELGGSKVDLQYDSRTTWTEPIDSSIYDLQDHVQENFLEIFDEAKNYKENAVGEVLGETVIRKVYRTIFVYVAAGVYYIFAIILGFFLSVIWGTVFGLNQVVVVWILQPLLKLLFSWLRIVSMILRGVVRMVCDPWWQAIGQMFSFIRGRFVVNVQAPGLLQVEKGAALTNK